MKLDLNQHGNQGCVVLKDDDTEVVLQLVSNGRPFLVDGTVTVCYADGSTDECDVTDGLIRFNATSESTCQCKIVSENKTLYTPKFDIKIGATA